MSRRDIEKAVRDRLTVEEQLLTIKFERRTMELEARMLRRSMNTRNTAVALTRLTQSTALENKKNAD